MIRKLTSALTILLLLIGFVVFPTYSQGEINDTTIAIAPLNGSINTPIQVIANGFPANTSVYIGVGEPFSEYEVISSAQTDAYGLVATQILIPDYLNHSSTDKIIVVVGTEDSLYDDAVSVPFTLMESNEMVRPIVNIIPRSGVAGTEVTVSATGFPSNEAVILGVSPQNGSFAYSLRETTNNNGMLITDITIPADARPNRNWTVLAELEDDRDYQAFSETFMVIGAESTPQPGGAEFTRADIYLVSLNDTSGKEIACGDSAVPVEVTFEPTVAPLTEALETMFDLDSQMIGQTGLYNALYQSDLTLNSINIENGVATIRIDGQLIVGGVCDTPRALAQIEQTTLQFSTIDEVNIYIGGEPYL